MLRRWKPFCLPAAERGQFDLIHTGYFRYKPEYLRSQSRSRKAPDLRPVWEKPLYLETDSLLENTTPEELSGPIWQLVSMYLAGAYGAAHWFANFEGCSRPAVLSRNRYSQNHVENAHPSPSHAPLDVDFC